MSPAVERALTLADVLRARVQDAERDVATLEAELRAVTADRDRWRAEASELRHAVSGWEDRALALQRRLELVGRLRGQDPL
jgi:FtsZ-binding cell division protein ZapB